MTEVTALKFDPTNTEQTRAWDGEEGAYWAAHAEHFDRSLVGYYGPFMAAAGIGPGDRVLDIGCGTGETTRDAARTATDGSVLGVDLSARMIELARRLAIEQGVANATFEHADAQIYAFPSGSFDLAISRTGTMFFGDPKAAFSNVARALRPGGRLTLLVWQGREPNQWLRDLSGALAAGRELLTPPTGAPGPFAQADPDHMKALLTGAGFSDIGLAGLSRPMWFGSDPDDAHAFVIGLMGWMLEGLDDTARDQATQSLMDTIARHTTAEGVTFPSATWLVTATRSQRRGTTPFFGALARRWGRA